MPYHKIQQFLNSGVYGKFVTEVRGKGRSVTEPPTFYSAYPLTGYNLLYTVP